MHTLTGILSVNGIACVAAVLVYLIPCVIMDVKKQKVSLFYAGGGAVCAAIWDVIRVGTGMDSLTGFLLSAFPGIMLLGISALTGKVGVGDGIVLLGIGFFLDWQKACGCLFIGLILSSVWSIYLLLFKKAGKGTRIPLMPFLLAGYGVVLLSEISAVS